MIKQKTIYVYSRGLEEWGKKKYGSKLEFQKAFVDKCEEFDKYKEIETTNIDEYMRTTKKLRGEAERYFMKEFIMDEIDNSIINVEVMSYDIDESKWYVTYSKE